VWAGRGLIRRPAHRGQPLPYEAFAEEAPVVDDSAGAGDGEGDGGGAGLGDGDSDGGFDGGVVGGVVGGTEDGPLGLGEFGLVGGTVGEADPDEPGGLGVGVVLADGAGDGVTVPDFVAG
jgi:hypothetical protein